MAVNYNNWAALGYRSKEDMMNDYGLKGEGERAASLGVDVFGDRSVLPSVDQNYIATGNETAAGAGTGSGTTYEPNYQTLYGFNGEVIGNYDLNNADDRARYFDDKGNYLNTVRQNYLNELQTTAKNNLSAAQLSTDKTLALIDQELINLETEAKNYVSDYTKRVNEFGDSKNLGDVNRLSYFSGLGANAFQSSNASSQGFANKKYLQGLGDFANEANTNVGGNFLANPNDINNLAAGSTFGQNRTGLIGQQNETKRAQNEYITNVNDSLTAGEKVANENYNLNMSNLSNSFTPINAAQGIDPFAYSRSNLPQATVNKTDISQYQPYTTFANPNNVFSSTGVKIAKTPNAFSSDTDYTPYIGANKLSSKDINYLSKYLMGIA